MKRVKEPPKTLTFYKPTKTAQYSIQGRTEQFVYKKDLINHFKLTNCQKIGYTINKTIIWNGDLPKEDLNLILKKVDDYFNNASKKEIKKIFNKITKKQ